MVGRQPERWGLSLAGLKYCCWQGPWRAVAMLIDLRLMPLMLRLVIRSPLSLHPLQRLLLPAARVQRTLL